jgi:hypothetical protein
VVLLRLEKEAKPTTGKRHQGSQNGLARVFRTRNFGGGEVSVEMRLEGWMACAELAFLFRTSAALGAGRGQDLSERELFGFHYDIIQHGQFESWSILLGGFCEISSKFTYRAGLARER